jgi:hypothetical protein
MSEEHFCKTCKKKLDVSEFTLNSKIFKTCNICRQKRSDQRKQNICDVCGIKAYYNIIGESIGIRCKTHKDLNMIDVITSKCVKCNKKIPNFNVEGEDKALYCRDCATTEMVDVKHTKCIKCKKTQPIFNVEGEDKALYCKKCAEPGMVDIINPKCVKCKKKQPVFNVEGEDKALYCKDCSEAGMVDIINPKCTKCKKTRPVFNVEGEDKALYCKDCSEPGMVDVKSSKCVKCKKTQPFFNLESEDKALYCKKCAEPGMVDVRSPKCVKCKKKTATFNDEGEDKALYCKDCSEPGMVDVRSPKCVKCKKTRPVFNVEGEAKALYCKKCAEPGMVDVKSPKCVKCKKIRPNFNIEGEDKALYCKKCAEPGMVDVIHPKCTECNTRVYYGYIGQNLSRCTRHKLPLMFKKTKVICEEEKCNEISEYGIDEPLHCFLHKKDNELCLIGQKCKKCNRENELCNNEGLCLTYCRPTEIDLNVKKIIKKKESLVLAYLDKNIKSDIEPIDDKIIDSMCVKRRPDRLYDCGSFYLICEIDENQHKGYTGCVFSKDDQELRRMIQIHEALNMGTIPCIFIRFNPDSFKVNGKIKKINMQKRLEVLSKWINYCINLNFKKEFKSENQIYIKYLFYDDYDETDISFETIDDDKLIELIN